MRLLVLSLFAAPWLSLAETAPQPSSPTESETVNRFFVEALARTEAYEDLRTLTSQSPGRLAGSKSLECAVEWAERLLTSMNLDRVYKQDVMVPHWERGAPESVRLLTSDGAATALAALALGGSGPSPESGVTAEVIEVR